MSWRKKWGGRTRWGLACKTCKVSHSFTEAETRDSAGVLIWSGWISGCGLLALASHESPINADPMRSRKCARCLAKE